MQKTFSNPWIRLLLGILIGVGLCLAVASTVKADVPYPDEQLILDSSVGLVFGEEVSSTELEVTVTLGSKVGVGLIVTDLSGATNRPLDIRFENEVGLLSQYCQISSVDFAWWSRTNDTVSVQMNDTAVALSCGYVPTTTGRLVFTPSISIVSGQWLTGETVTVNVIKIPDVVLELGFTEEWYPCNDCVVTFPVTLTARVPLSGAHMGFASSMTYSVPISLHKHNAASKSLAFSDTYAAGQIIYSGFVTTSRVNTSPIEFQSIYAGKLDCSYPASQHIAGCWYVNGNMAAVERLQFMSQYTIATSAVIYANVPFTMSMGHCISGDTQFVIGSVSLDAECVNGKAIATTTLTSTNPVTIVGQTGMEWKWGSLVVTPVLAVSPLSLEVAFTQDLYRCNYPCQVVFPVTLTARAPVSGVRLDFSVPGMTFTVPTAYHHYDPLYQEIYFSGTYTAGQVVWSGVVTATRTGDPMYASYEPMAIVALPMNCPAVSGPAFYGCSYQNGISGDAKFVKFVNATATPTPTPTATPVQYNLYVGDITAGLPAVMGIDFCVPGNTQFRIVGNGVDVAIPATCNITFGTATYVFNNTGVYTITAQLLGSGGPLNLATGQYTVRPAATATPTATATPSATPTVVPTATATAVGVDDSLEVYMDLNTCSQWQVSVVAPGAISIKVVPGLSGTWSTGQLTQSLVITVTWPGGVNRVNPVTLRGSFTRPACLLHSYLPAISSFGTITIGSPPDVFVPLAKKRLPVK